MLTTLLGAAVQVLARPESFDVAVTTYEMVNSAEFGRPIQSTIVRSSCYLGIASVFARIVVCITEAHSGCSGQASPHAVVLLSVFTHLFACWMVVFVQTWRYLVLDEGHRVRNMDTLTAKALRSVQRGNVLLLTGTAWQ